MYSDNSAPSRNGRVKTGADTVKAKAGEKPEKQRVYVIGHDMGYARRRVTTRSGQWWQWDREGRMTEIDEPGQVSEYKAGRWW
jgi:hypothetical protein